MRLTLTVPPSVLETAKRASQALECSVCGETKSVEDYYLKNGKPHGRRCKECVKASIRKHQASLPKQFHAAKVSAEIEITLDVVRRLVRYDAKEGKLYWLKNTGGKGFADSECGYIADSGYRMMGFAGIEVRAHRIVWLLEHGAFPAEDLVIDHINRNRSDNRIENLRAVPQVLNAHNIVKAKKNSTTGLLGVHRNKKRFSAGLYVDHKPKHLGTFDTPEQAHAAYVEAKKTFYPEAVIA